MHAFIDLCVLINRLKWNTELHASRLRWSFTVLFDYLLLNSPNGPGLDQRQIPSLNIPHRISHFAPLNALQYMHI